MSQGRQVPVGRAAGAGVRDNGVYYCGERLLDVDDVPLPGRHNLDNIAAAIAATYDFVGGDRGVLRSGIRAVRPLPHRLQVVATVDGVTFVDDSLSTTPQTTIAAMAAFDRPQVLILGGSTKGVSLAPLADAVVAGRVRAALLVGAEAARIAAALNAVGFDDHVTVAGPMPDVVERAFRAARPGDVVLLSPACSSVGEFRDYADRGAQFVAAVEGLTP
jgi:UDP-N-acetylmuramoylalanine--D-glutamate ligase